jgi:integrase
MEDKATQKSRDLKKHFTDRTLLALKPQSKEYTVWDDDEARPGFGVRVSPKGMRTFFLAARYPGSRSSGRRRLGRYPRLPLAAARRKADEWLELIAKGIDPEAEIRRQLEDAERAKRSEKLKTENSVPARAEEYLGRRNVKEQRQYGETARILRRELVKPWQDRLLNDISRRDVIDLIEGIDSRGSPAMARNTLTVAKLFFEWAEDKEYVTASPAAGIRSDKLLGEKKPRRRLLSDDEIRAFWKATARLGYPYQPLYRLLLLTGVRLREGAEAQWSEFQFDERRWLIPPDRFKSEAVHIVPLTAPVVELINALPAFGEADRYLFSTTSGRLPVSGFSKAKAKVDILMAEELSEAPAPWVIHDLRRVVRSKLASLKIPDTVAEMVLGHGKRGLQRTYDLHQYEPELREALELWASKLRDITEPPPKNVVKMKARA